MLKIFRPIYLVVILLLSICFSSQLFFIETASASRQYLCSIRGTGSIYKYYLEPESFTSFPKDNTDDFRKIYRYQLHVTVICESYNGGSRKPYKSETTGYTYYFADGNDYFRAHNRAPSSNEPLWLTTRIEDGRDKSVWVNYEAMPNHPATHHILKYLKYRLSKQ